MPADWRIRPHALEFLTYLIVRGGLIYQHDIRDDLVPGPRPRLADQRMHTYTYHLRETFVLLGGERSALRLRRHQYSLNPDAFEVDLWIVRAAIAAATAAPDPATRIAALRRAVVAYGGPLAAESDHPYLWIEKYRTEIRREYITAAVGLAEAADRPDDAAAVLEVALRHHPDDAELTAGVDRLSRC